VYKPVLETVPPEAVQVTEVLLVPDTFALKGDCWPTCKEAVVGDTVTDTPLDAVPAPNIETRQDDLSDADHHVAGSDVRLVCWLVTEWQYVYPP
jgi:hypothetical protein